MREALSVIVPGAAAGSRPRSGSASGHRPPWGPCRMWDGWVALRPCGVGVCRAAGRGPPEASNVHSSPEEVLAAGFHMLSYVSYVLERLSGAARRMVTLAEDEARRLGHRHVGTEHLLLGILAEGESAAARTLVACGATLDAARQKVTEAVPVDGPGSHIDDLRLTDRANRALERAARLSLRQHDEHVETEHVLVSLLDVEGTAGQVLRGLAVDLARVRVTLESAVEQARASAGTGDDPALGRPLPRCGACGSALDTTLAHHVVTSQGEGQQSRQFLVAFCAACGLVVGVDAV